MTDSTFHITVKPKSKKNEAIKKDGLIIVAVTSPPVEGAANDAVIKVLAEALHIPKSRLSIAGGATGKLKKIAVSNITTEELNSLLEKINEAK
jgi:uncharacterized protein (TIGR00251 family)